LAAIRKTAVEDTTLGPYNCPKGTGVIVSIWALAHNPDVW
jgi:cytochrome P450